jgi:hypothetical protein
MKLLNNESGQAGGIVMFVFGILLIGYFFVAFSEIMNQIQGVNNDIITNPSIAYSQDHYDAMDLIFKSWWAIPIYAIILFIVWGIKNALEKEAGEV